MGRVSKVWKFFHKSPQNKDKVICDVCESTLSSKGGVTTPLINHLKTHKKEFSEYETLQAKDNSKESTKSTSSQPAINTFLPQNTEMAQKTLDEAITHFLAESGVAFRIVDLESFKKIIKVSNPKLRAKGKTFYSKLVSERADEMRKTLIHIIESQKAQIDTISFTSDIWTSQNGDPYICLTLQFIDANWDLWRFTPYVRPFPDRHTGVNISLNLDKMIEQLSLDSGFKLFCVNDSAANMILGIKLSKYLSEYTCDIHKLENTIKDGIKNSAAVDKLIGCTKKIAKFALKSPVALHELKSECKKSDVQFKKPVNPPRTRWTGFQKNLSSVQHLKSPISALTNDKDNWGEFHLLPNDWRLLESCIHLLKPFSETVRVFEAEKEPTIHHVIERIYTLGELLKQFINKHKNDTSYKSSVKFAKELQASLNKRFPRNGTDDKLRCMANYLAPQFKGIHLQGKITDVKTNIRDLASPDPDVTPTPDDNSQTGDDDTDDITLSPTSKLKMKYKQDRNKKSDSDDGSDNDALAKEFIKYEMFSLAPASVKILDWWKSHEKILPILAKVAKTVLTIPCSSAKSERVFSCAGNYSTKKRNKLGLKKLEDLVVYKQNHEAIASFKVKYPHLKIVADRNSFDKIRMEETDIQEPEDPRDHALLCEDTVESEEEVDTDEDEDEIII